MPVTVVVGLQYGDEGKGKIVDYLAQNFGLIIRHNGGANAGHTVVNEIGTFKLNLVPSGIFSKKARCMLGSGMVIDADLLAKELDELAQKGIDTSNLFVSACAHLVMPWHKTADMLAEKAKGGSGIGTTQRGIGPCYSDKADRVGIRAGDLLDIDHLRGKFVALYDLKRRELGALYPDQTISWPGPAELLENMRRCGAALAGKIVDVGREARMAAAAGERVLIESAQGAMIDIDFGTYPYVTSSFTTSAGACVGSGLPPQTVSNVVGVAKAYTTRVGSGPFPTELLDSTGELLQKNGNEFGTTTGRKRRCGWFDVPAVRYAAKVNGAESVALTKLDVLSSMQTLRIATAYQYKGQRRERPPVPPEPYEEYVPVYEELEGWKEPIADVTSWTKLPRAAKEYVERIEQLLGVFITAVATGPGRKAIIERYPGLDS